MSAPVLTCLYVPGDRPDRFDKARDSGADVVVIDLEDAVVPAAKLQARRAAAEWIAAGPKCRVQVRVNAVGSPWFADDIAALRPHTGMFEIRLPKVESPDALTFLRQAAGDDVAVHPLVETARGIENALVIAEHPAASSLGLGESDLRAELGLDGEAALAWVRSRVVVAARAAGLPAPLMSVWPDVADMTGLARSCQTGRALGMFGRAVIHPRQIPVVVQAFRPAQHELDHARAVIAALDDAAGQGRGVATLPSGAMVDAAMRAAADRVLAIEEAAAGREGR